MRFNLSYPGKINLGKFEEKQEEASLLDISLTGVGFTSKIAFMLKEKVRIVLFFKKNRFEFEGKIVRAFGAGENESKTFYGVEVDQEDRKETKDLIKAYIKGFSLEKARECLGKIALADRNKSIKEGFEVFSLMISLFKDILSFGEKEDFIKSMLEEVSRIVNAQKAYIFLINPSSNELESWTEKKNSTLKFDYRKGIAGRVFTSSISLNIDCEDKRNFISEEEKEIFQKDILSLMCFPITNREDKTIGVIQVINKRNQDRFTYDDEKTMKVLSLIFSSLFHKYNPTSEKSLVRRFSAPYDRDYAYVGNSKLTGDIRKKIVKIKDLDCPVLITGERGVWQKVNSKNFT